MADILDRLEDKIARCPMSGCWIWTGATGGIGSKWEYGQIIFEGAVRAAHAITYRLFVGPIPDGMELDHLCRNTFCVNPWHLEPVTHVENIRRGNTSASAKARHAARTSCVRGHDFTPENTYLDPDGSRECQTCRRAARRRYEDRQ